MSEKLLSDKEMGQLRDGLSEKLKSCPFCRGKLDLTKHNDNDVDVDCESCEFGLDGFLSEEKAIEFINTRYPDTELLVKIKGLRWGNHGIGLGLSKIEYNKRIDEIIELL